MSAIVVRSGINRTISVYLTAVKAGDVAGSVDVTSSTDFLGHVKSIQLPQPETEEIDVTDYDSPEGSREFEQGSVDFGTANTVRNLNSSEFEDAFDLAAAGTHKWLTFIVKDKSGTAVMKYQVEVFVKYPQTNNTDINGVLEVTTEYRCSGAMKKFSGAVS